MRAAFLPRSLPPTRDLERMSRMLPPSTARTRMTISSLKPYHSVVSVASLRWRFVVGACVQGHQKSLRLLNQWIFSPPVGFPASDL